MPPSAPEETESFKERRAMERAPKIDQENGGFEPPDNFRTFFDLCPDFLFVLDMEGRILLANRTVLQLLGYSKGELRGKSVLLLHPEDRQEEAGTIVAAMVEGTGDYCPIPLLTRDGREIPVETRVVMGQWNSRPCLFGYSRNMTELKRSEEKFRTAFESNAALMAISRLSDGQFIEVNEAFLDALGYERNEVIGQSSGSLGIFEDPHIREEMIEMIAQNKPVRNQEIIVCAADGRRLVGLFSAVILKGGVGESHLLTVMNDITDRKRAEKQLHESQERLQLALEGARLGTWDWDVETGHVHFDKRWVGMLGYTPEEIEPHVRAWEKLLHPEDALQARAVLQDHLEGRTESYETEHRLRSRSGEWVWVLDSGRVTRRDEQGRALRMAGIHMNISARKEAEIELQRHRDNLEQLVKERTRKLEQAQNELVKRAMEAGRAQILDLVLHNIGNAVTPIFIQTETLTMQNKEKVIAYLHACYEDLLAHKGKLDGYLEEDPRGREIFSYMGSLLETLLEQQKGTADIIAAIRNAVDHISGILRTQSASLTAVGVKSRIDLAESVEEAIQIQQYSLKKRGIQLKTELASGVVVTGERSGLMQVVMNLIKNAYESVDAAGQAAVGKEITIRACRQGDGTCLEVSDTGIGIGAEHLQTVLERGVSEKGSSGFGLFYCKTWAEENGGVFSIESPGEGQGATVRLTFAE